MMDKNSPPQKLGPWLAES